MEKPASLFLNGKALPWVSSATHLGHEIHESGTMELDARMKRAKFISDTVEVRDSFDFASPVEVLRAVKTYCGALYGAMLWDLGGSGADQIFKSWNTCVKLTWQVPRATRTYFLDQLLMCGLTSVKSDVMSRYTKFLQTLTKSPSSEVVTMSNIVSRDVRSTTGSNVQYILNQTGLDANNCSLVEMRKTLKMCVLEPDACDMWRLKYLQDLLTARGDSYYRGEVDTVNTITVLIESLCIN